jgi:hypothetical protein
MIAAWQAPPFDGAKSRARSRQLDQAPPAPDKARDVRPVPTAFPSQRSRDLQYAESSPQPSGAVQRRTDTACLLVLTVCASIRRPRSGRSMPSGGAWCHTGPRTCLSALAASMPRPRRCRPLPPSTQSSLKRHVAPPLCVAPPCGHRRARRAANGYVALAVLNRLEQFRIIIAHTVDARADRIA